MICPACGLEGQSEGSCCSRCGVELTVSDLPVDGTMVLHEDSRIGELVAQTHEHDHTLDLDHSSDLESDHTLDSVDGAARVLAPIFDGFNSGVHCWGQFLKDYQPTRW